MASSSSSSASSHNQVQQLSASPPPGGSPPLLMAAAGNHSRHNSSTSFQSPFATSSATSSSPLYYSSTATSPLPLSGAAVESRPALRRKRSSFSDIFKILVVGAEGSGKSALVVRFMTKKYIGEYGQNIDCKYRHSEFITNDRILIDLVDTCSRGSPDGITSADNIKWCDGFIIMYSVTDRSTFHHLEALLPRIFEVRRSVPAANTPIIIVGNKVDLDRRRTVSTEEGEMFAKDNNCLFRELSVAEDIQAVRKVMLELCFEISLTKPRSRSFLEKVFSNIGGVAGTGSGGSGGPANNHRK